jgi:hypothetical protein
MEGSMATALSQGQGQMPTVNVEKIHPEVVPIRSPHVCIREETEDGSTYLLYHTELETPYLINQTARTILDLCDGQRSLDQINQHLSKSYAIPGEVDLEPAVCEYLLVLQRLHMITF